MAERLRLAPVEVFEVARFYAHFEIVDDEAPRPLPALRLCQGLPCALAGAADLMATLQRSPPPGVRLLPSPCMGACDRPPAAALGHRLIVEATAARLADAMRQGADSTAAADPPAPDLASWRARGGHIALSRSLSAAAMIDALAEAGLRGLGGAGFPAARKWQLVLRHPPPRYLVVNADESEPGTFKDRFCLESEPHRVLEGMLLAAHAIRAEACWIYLRHEYHRAHALLTRAIAELHEAGLAPCPIHLRRGAGAYICGEETALLESLEGRRGWPRHKPPFPADRGLFGRPTLVHNVETLWWLPEILAAAEAPRRFAAAGRNGQQGKRLFSVSGRVRHPGVIPAPNGISAAELIALAGGMAEGHALVAFLPGGAAGGILPARLAHLPLGFGTLEAEGGAVGSGAVIVLSQQDDLCHAVRNLVAFFRDESCGQCTPCRVGTAKAVRLLDAPSWDRALLSELAEAMAEGSICGLGQAAMNPVRAVLRHFPEVVP